jgi:2-iminobutanoate/2-iminopropanoate deaminase
MPDDSLSQTARAVRTENAPAPVGPYSQALVHGDIAYLSGQIPLDPATGKLAAEDIEGQTRQVLANLRAVLEAAGASLDSVLRTTIYLVDLGHFPDVNAIYAEHFQSEPAPARATVQVAALPLGAQIEIDAIAVVR